MKNYCACCVNKRSPLCEHCTVIERANGSGQTMPKFYITHKSVHLSKATNGEESTVYIENNPQALEMIAYLAKGYPIPLRAVMLYNASVGTREEILYVPKTDIL